MSEADTVPSSSGTALPPGCAGCCWLCHIPASESVCSSSPPRHSSSTVPAWKEETPTKNSAPHSQNLQEPLFQDDSKDVLVGWKEKLKTDLSDKRCSIIPVRKHTALLSSCPGAESWGREEKNSPQ